MSKSRALVCLLFLVGGISISSHAVTADRITHPLSAGPTIALKGNVHRNALPEYDAGPVDPAMLFGSITLLTVPTAQQQKALSQLVADQQNPKSPQYHKWLTPEQWADQFGLSHNDIQQITSWLKAQGFTVQNVARGRNWVVVSGTAAQVARTFGTQLHRYSVKGEMHVANATAPKIPAALAGIVTGIRGLNDFHLRPRAKVRPNYYSSTLQAQFIAPGDLATIYDINALYNGSTAIDGTGQKLAVIGQTDIYVADISNFRTGFGLSAISCSGTTASGVITACSDPHFSYVVADGLKDPGTTLSGDLSEADLDIELSTAVARGAQIVFVNAPATFNGNNLVSGGVWEAWYYAVDQNLAPVISLSYGTCEFGDNNVLTSTGTAGADEVELKKANSEGITFVNSTGDTGAAECDFGGTNGTLISPGQLATQGLALGYPASSPEVTGVGGTAIPITNFGTNYWTQTNGTDGNSVVANSYIPEQAWNDDLEFYEACQGNNISFCTTGNNTGVPITSEATAQNAIGISSTGGGPSNCAQQSADNSTCIAGFSKPSWQTVTLSGQPSVRYSPDVSFLATPNFPGYIFCTELSELPGDSGTGSACASGIANALTLPVPPIIGGTSASAPIFAGMIALMNQYLLVDGDISTPGLGNVNQKLYQLAANSSNGAFNKINVGDNNVYCSPNTPTGMPTSIQCPTTGVFGFSASTSDATTGYNLVTGLGSVDANKLAVAWAASYVNFSVSPSPASVSVAAGQSTNPTTITITPIKNYTGPATYSCPSGPSGATCTFTTVNSTSSTLVINTAADMAAVSNAVVTVQATDTVSGLAKTTTVNLSVTKTTESFSLTSSLGSNASLAVTQGQTSGPVNLTVSSTSTPPFVSGSQTALPLTYSCAGLPSESTCNFLPSSTTAALSVSLTITTTAPTGKLIRPLDRGPSIFYAVLFPGLLGIVVTLGARRRSLNAMRMLVLITLLIVSALWMTSCGGSSSSNKNPGTPTGSYPITINATTGGASPLTSSVKLTLNVQ
ncbi:MAG: protease pro-enzyme activation domain-containing protein [Candidatus Sulfotelmatobacter sp.]